MDNIVRTAIIGCGRMARGHIRHMLARQDNNRIVVVSEPSQEAYDALVSVFTEAGQPAPPNQPDLKRLLEAYDGQLDAAFIITPHAYHFEQARSCLEAGLDVLLEKPMVVTADEARQLIATRDRTQHLLVVSFNGSLSARIRMIAPLLHTGEFGEMLSIVAVVWEDWATKYRGHWKQDYPVSGGGFMFDTGAHMLNTVADLAGQDFVEVGAWLDHRSAPVDIVGTVMGRLASGVQVTLHACGETVPSCASDIHIFCTRGIIRTGVWGEFLEIQRVGDKDLVPVEMPSLPNAWEQFVAVRQGEIENPAPPEVGLRMAKLWDAIQQSAHRGGQLIQVG